MLPRVQIIFPVISKLPKQSFFRGYVKSLSATDITIFIIRFTANRKLVQQNIEDKDIIYGYSYNYGDVPFVEISPCQFNNFLILDQIHEPRIEKLILNGKLHSPINNCVIVFYDYDRICESEVEWEYSDNLSKLKNLVQNENHEVRPHIRYEKPLKCPLWLSSSMFLQHLVNYLNIIHWLISTIKSKKISIRHGNLLMAILMDLILGYLTLSYITDDKTELSSMLMGVLEKLINLLYSLLKWLMGAPAGLKLNNAFNKMLGKYFSYHVQLWWLFLDVSGEKLNLILHIYHYLGYLGFTIQAAVIADMICIATFHSYCIYVYAARMFNIQISGLIALLRFFVGRKYNPLRGSIDSCEYTNQELFVGTVAFTILLLLLPTTLMYYIVFTVFRLLSLLVQYTLAKIIYIVHTLPLYVSLLWMINSPKVAGNVLLEVINKEEDLPLTLRLKLHKKSLFYLISHFIPPVDMSKSLVWTKFFTNVFTGKQII